MVNIYYESINQDETVDNSWRYWGEFKSEEHSFFVWYKKVTQEEADRYELEKDLLN